MSKNNTVFIIGVILLLMPNVLGFPISWKNFLDVIFGIILIGLSFSVTIKRRASSRKTRRNRRNPTVTPVFVDGMGHQDAQPSSTTYGAPIKINETPNVTMLTDEDSSSQT